MGINLKAIKSRMTYLDINQEAAAKKIGISSASFNYKLNGKREFIASELVILAALLQVSIEFFFDNNVEKFSPKEDKK